MSGDCDIPFVVLEKHLREKSLVRSPYPSCYNFVEFFLGRSCIKSCTLVVTFSLTNSPGLVFFGPQVPPGAFLDHTYLLGCCVSKKPVNMIG